MEDDVLRRKEVVSVTFDTASKTVYLRVTRRRWRDKENGKVYSRDWDMVAHVTRITAEFGAFLKQLHL